VIIEESLYPRISHSLALTGAKFPEYLATSFARILQRIELMWGSKESLDYLDSLFLGDMPDDIKNQSHRTDHSNLAVSSNRATRQGFPIEAIQEIVLLKQVHQLLYPALNFNPYDPFSGSELVPIEIHSNTENQPDDFPASDADDTITLDFDSVTSNTKPRTIWPIIRTQHELTESALLHQNGDNIYPMQGKPVGEILMHYRIIDEDTLRIVRDMQKRPSHKNQPLGELLVDIGIIRPEELTNVLLIQAGILIVDVLSLEISSEVTKIISFAHAREKLAVPIGLFRDTLYLAVGDPFTFQDQSFFALMTGMKICLVFAPLHDIVNRINMHGVSKKNLNEAKAEFRTLAKKDKSLPQELPVIDKSNNNDLSENDSVIVNLVNQMILSAVQEEASDIHIEIFSDNKEASIRFRRDGNMEHFSDFPRTYHKAVVSRIKIMSGLDISETRRPQDGKITFNLPNDSHIDLRVATIPAMPGIEFVTIRILSSGEPLPLGNLGMANRDMTVFREIFQRPYGLILVCGPTGSGKTTTLHTVLKELNTEERKIWTAEDPVEIVQPHLCQIQVNSKIGMTFATVLRSLLRADPDVIMIGEMRDHETAKIALEASMTGHLVLSTLHTNSASETVARLLDLGIDPYNLSDSLLAILAQRLARKLCPACARSEEASAPDLEDLAKEYYLSAHSKPPSISDRNTIIHEWRENYGIDGNIFIKHAVGCESCRSGYKGRIGLYELLQATPDLKHLIREQSSAADYLTMGVTEGMRTLKQDGIEKVIRGMTDIMQVHSACI
jgi:type II secretory ATPase GspE/PulE/Tfp pilus assembly ATPase PilB-like protein